MRWFFLFLFPLLLCADDISSTSEEIKPDSSPVHLSTDVYQKQFSRTLIIALIIVIGAFTLIWFTRRLSKDRPLQMNHHKNLKILERRQISPNTYLYHMQIGSKQFVISESKLDVRLVATLDWEVPDSPV